MRIVRPIAAPPLGAFISTVVVDERTRWCACVQDPEAAPSRMKTAADARTTSRAPTIKVRHRSDIRPQHNTEIYKLAVAWRVAHDQPRSREMSHALAHLVAPDLPESTHRCGSFVCDADFAGHVLRWWV